MASDKDKDKKSKAAEKLAAETAAKKRKEEEAQVASTFMASGSAAPSEACSDEESVGPSRTVVDAPASPAPSTGTGCLTTSSSTSWSPHPRPPTRPSFQECAKAEHLEEQLVKLHKQLQDQQQQVTPTEAATVHKGLANVHSPGPLRHAPGGATARPP
eukprot:3940712-Rhodomonas_salina.1